MRAAPLQSFRDDLVLQDEPRRYLRPVVVGVLLEVLAAGVCSIAVGIIGFGLLHGYPAGAAPAGRVFAITCLGVLVVAVAVAAGGLTCAALLRSAHLPQQHARAVGAVVAVAVALGWFTLAGVVGGASLGQWLAALLGTALGLVVILLRGVRV